MISSAQKSNIVLEKIFFTKYFIYYKFLLFKINQSNSNSYNIRIPHVRLVNTVKMRDYGGSSLKLSGKNLGENGVDECFFFLFWEISVYLPIIFLYHPPPPPSP